MSIHVMSIVWRCDNLTPTDKLVLLSLADHANDEGVCYPSIQRLAVRTGLSKRGTQTAIKRLEAAGWLKIEINAGPKGCNVFTVSPPQEMHPAGDAPLQEVRDPPQQMRLPPAGDAPEPSLKHQEPSEKKKDARDKPPPLARLPNEWVMPAEYIAYAANQGLSDQEIADEKFAFHAYFIDKGERRSERGWLASWQGWVRRSAERKPKRHRPSDRPRDRPDPALEQALRLSGLG